MASILFESARNPFYYHCIEYINLLQIKLRAALIQSPNSKDFNPSPKVISTRVSPNVIELNISLLKKESNTPFYTSKLVIHKSQVGPGITHFNCDIDTKIAQDIHSDPLVYDSKKDTRQHYQSLDSLFESIGYVILEHTAQLLN